MVGLGSSIPCYYRIMLPAMALSCDWVGVVGEPPHLGWTTGGVRGESQLPDFIDNYKVVVLQQPHGEAWVKMIHAMQERGKKVLFEVDDYLHGINEREDHQFKDAFDQKAMLRFEEAIRACDGVICSTEYILRKYAKFNDNMYLCRNGIDLKRYDLGKPKRETVNIGWAGATGHLKAVIPWLNQVFMVMQMKPETCFISIGQNFADALKEFGDRAISVPWAAIEQYPAAMTMFDIALAPGGSGGWYRGKSDLRWLEAGALGVPIIARPNIYPEIEDGVTGFHAANPNVMIERLTELVGDKELRERVGKQARDYIREHRSIEAMSGQWRDAFNAIHNS